GNWSYVLNNSHIDVQSLTAGETLTRTFTVTSADGTDTHDVTITIVGTNDGPVATSNEYGINEAQSVTGNLIDDNTGSGIDSDLDGDTLSVTNINGTPLTFVGGVATVNITGGTLTVNENGDFTFAHDGSTASIPDFTYTVSDGNSGTDTATVTLNYNDVDAENDGEAAATTTIAADFSNGPTIPVDGNGDPLFTMRAISYDTNGNEIDGSFSTINGEGIGVSGSIRSGGQIADQIEFDPGTGRSEGIEIQFNELVSQVEFDVARLFANENVAEQGVWKVYYNGELVGSGIFSNTDGDTGTFDTSSLGPDVVFDTIVFEAINNLDPILSGDSSDYVLTSITATGAGLGDGALVTGEDDNLTVTDPTIGLLANDTDLQGDNFGITQINGADVTNGSTVTLASGALLTIYANGTYDYNPNNAFDSLSAGEVAQDTFTYTVTDVNGATDTATVTINIIGENDAPIGNADAFTVAEGDALALTNDSFVANDIDPEGNAMTVAGFALDNIGTGAIDATGSGNTLTTALGGIVTINPDGSYSYQAPGNIDHSAGNVTDTFYYQSTNGNENGEWTQITVELTDTAPTAVNDFDFVGFGGTAYGSVITGAGTDGSGVDTIGADTTTLTSVRVGNTVYDSFDADGNLTITVNNGVLTINQDGSYNFVSTVPEVNGQASVRNNFWYTLTDSDGDSSEARLRITQDSTPNAESNVDSVNESGISGGTTAGDGSQITTGNLLDNDGGISGSTVITEVNGATAVNGVITVTTALGQLTVYTEDTADNRAGDYEYTLTSVSSGDDISDSFTYTVENALGNSDSAGLTINVVDDAPVTQDISQNLQSAADPITTNITLVLDVSGSMGNPAGNGLTYLETAVQALTALINEVDDTGNVNVQLVSFSSGAASTGWMVDDVAGAIAALEALIANGGTNYAAALNQVMTNTTLPPADQSLLYFISDGEPNSGGEVTSTLQTTWENYLNGVNQGGVALYDIAFGIGIGNADLTEIFPISHPEPNGAEEYAVQVDDASDLTSTIINYFEGNTISGDLGILSAESTSGVLIGADGGQVTSIEIDGNAYSYDPANPIQVITTLLGGQFTVNFETGEYSYEIEVDRNVLNQSENVEITVTDGDGDVASLDLVLNIDYYAGVDANANNVITNLTSGSTIDIPVEYLTHGDRTPYDTQITSVTGDGTLANDVVTVTNATDASTFNYVIDGNGATDSADVDFDFTSSNVLTGTAESDIIIANNSNASSDATINATVRPGNTYNTNGNNQIGFTFATATAGLFIASISIDLRAGTDTNAIFDTGDRLGVGNTVGLNVSTSDFVLSDSNSVITVNFSDNEFTNGDELWFSVDTDNLGSNNGGDFASSGVTFTVTFSDGSTQTAVYVADGSGGSQGTIAVGYNLLDGGAGDDVLIGGTGNDYLLGGEGDDILIGGLGDDILTGGADADIFVWQDGETGTDHITDFDVTKDQLDLSDLLHGEENGNLENFLHFSLDGNSTVIEIDSDPNQAGFEQQIVLDGVNLFTQFGITEGDANADSGIISNLLDNNGTTALIVDTATGNTAQNAASGNPLELNNGISNDIP
ncbi:beta strand repeat-containing protein, partial [Shewanella gelidii]